MKIEKLDSLRPGSREMEEGGRWEGQNFQQLKKVQRLEEEEEVSYCSMSTVIFLHNSIKNESSFVISVDVSRCFAIEFCLVMK